MGEGNSESSMTSASDKESEDVFRRLGKEAQRADTVRSHCAHSHQSEPPCRWRIPWLEEHTQGLLKEKRLKKKTLSFLYTLTVCITNRQREDNYRQRTIELITDVI